MACLEEDFSDVKEFVKEDDSCYEQNASEDEVERKIDEEHAKFREAQAKRQEEVRANRPWSSPPIESPRPEQQKERERERKARTSTSDSSGGDAPRSEYEPPARPYLPAAQASGSNLSYLSRPQSAELRGSRRPSNSGTRSYTTGMSPASLSGIEEEAVVEAAATSRRPSEVERMGSPTHGGGGTGAPDDTPGRDQNSPALKEEDEDGIDDEDEDEELLGSEEGEAEEEERVGVAEGEGSGAYGGRQDASEDGALNATFEVRPLEEAERRSWAGEGDVGGTSVELDPVPWGSTNGALAKGALALYGEEAAPFRNQEDEGEGDAGRLEQRWLVGAVYGGVQPSRVEEEEEEVHDGVVEEEQQEQRRASAASGGGGLPYSWSGTAKAVPPLPEVAGPTMAMRGFVQPLPCDSSYDHPGDGRPPALGAEPASMEIEGLPQGPPVHQESSVGGAVPEEEVEEEGRPTGQAAGAEAEGSGDAENEYSNDKFESEAEEEEEEREGGQGGAGAAGTQAAAGERSGAEGTAEAPPTHAPSREASEQQQQVPSAGLSSPPPAASEPSQPPVQQVPQPPASEPSQQSISPRAAPSAVASERSLPTAPGPPPQPPAAEASSPRAPPSADSSYASSTPPAPRQPANLPPLQVASHATPEASPHPSPPAPSTSSLSKAEEDAAAAAAAASRRAAAAAAVVNNLRTVSGPGIGVGAIGSNAAPLPPPDAAFDLLPPQQFAMQLLKHDIDVLPQHHRVAAEAAAARRRPMSARPAGAGLASFGYLGYHVPHEDLTAPSGVGGQRNPSPGRTASPGRGGGDVVDDEDDELYLAVPRSQHQQEQFGEGVAEGAADGGYEGARPISAPHMRPGLEADRGGREPVPPPPYVPSVHFTGGAAARGGRMLPPVAPQPPFPARGGGRRESSGAPGGGGIRMAAAADSPPSESSMSVLDEAEAAATPNRIKYDVWMDQMSGTSKAASEAVGNGAKQHIGDSVDGDMDDGAAAAPEIRRPVRPMTAPASGRRRPASARPVMMAGVYGTNPQQQLVNVPRPLGRPMSAQPHHLRPASASRRGGGGTANGGVGYETPRGLLLNVDAPVPVTMPPPEQATAAGGTAAVAVAGVTVSVYVADTLKRIVEANRWLQQLGVTSKRYRLKDRLSNMTVQLCEDLPPPQLPLEDEFYDSYDVGYNPAAAAGGVKVIKELNLKQFLSGHAKLKQQVKKLRQTGTPPLPPSSGSGAIVGLYGGAGGSPHGFVAAEAYVGGGGKLHNRPFSASAGVSASAGGSIGVGGRVRPASAVPYSGGSRGTAAAGEPHAPYGGAANHHAHLQHQHHHHQQMRPNSANPACGRGPVYNTLNSGGSPPLAVPSSKHSNAVGVAAGLRPAWGTTAGTSAGAAVGSSQLYHPNHNGGGNGGINGLPYMYRSASAHTRMPSAILDEEDAEEEPVLLEPDERGDISRAVRQHLGGVAEYCQTKRNEIARLRNMPLM
ncbi:hypothetical protein Agub_g6015 [Astrephomene gubernaculifera]|uniref:Uncharacterized protein n=1 Tax=Astrephomene gubernaculifera TaxID=47775 RepID=A0AAD3HKQ6_9CHLO|nr:hypothetical protein Agub_g6015 [Astrephomene gubernaculifera]